MQRLRGCPSIIVLLFYFACLWRATLGMCPIRCNCNDEALRAMCESAALEFVPITLNPELRELRMSRNNIKGALSSFGVYRNLHYLDISHNQIISVGHNNFQSQHHLQFLLLNNNHISTLANNTFFGLVALQVLHLDHNRLETIPEQVLNPLKALEKLDLSSNRIQNLSSGAFAGLANLKTLLLRDNKLSSIPTPAFRNLTNLLVLDLGLNTFQTIPAGVFSSLRELEKLSLDGCGISSLLPGAFRSLTSLLSLNLNDNLLTTIPSLQEVSRLEEVYIGRNLFVSLEERAFRGLGYLKKVEIVGSLKLQRVLKNAFVDNSNMERIILNRNPYLVDLEVGSFGGIPNLRHVSLRANGLMHVDPRLLSWDELETLDLRDNPLECDCSILWLRNLLLRRNFSSELVGVGCAGSPVGRLLLDIPSDELECETRDSRRQLIIGVVIATLVIVGVLAMAAFRYRTRLAVVLKNRWGSGRKEPQYQKTSGDEDILQVAQQSLKNSPVTEL